MSELKKIYIAKDYNGNCTNVVLTESKDLADAFFQGIGDTPHSVECINMEEVSGEYHPKVLTLFTSTQEQIGASFDRVPVLKRGR